MQKTRAKINISDDGSLMWYYFWGSSRDNCSGKGQTSGASKEHGFGLKNIRRIAEKYHGSLTAAVQDGDFHASVLLFLEDADTE